MAKQYYTVCTFEDGKWYDEFGSYSRKEANEEAAFIREDQSHRYKRGWVKVISHDDNAEAMIAARDALAIPK